MRGVFQCINFTEVSSRCFSPECLITFYSLGSSGSGKFVSAFVFYIILYYLTLEKLIAIQPKNVA